METVRNLMVSRTFRSTVRKKGGIVCRRKVPAPEYLEPATPLLWRPHYLANHRYLKLVMVSIFTTSTVLYAHES